MTRPDETHNGDDRSLCTQGAVSAIVFGMDDGADSLAELESGSPADLAALLQAVASRNRAAFERLYDVTVQAVFSLAMRIARQRPLAEEVVSDVYLQVWQQAGSYSPERGTVIAWLCMLCRSRALDALRRDQSALRQGQVGLDTVPELQDPNAPPDLLSAMEQGTAVHAALGCLTDQQRQLIGLAYFRGYTHSELAAITALPIGTVKTNLHRAMIKLKELMSEETCVSGGPDE